MSEREQQERVTARAEPLAETQARLESTVRARLLKWTLIALLTGATGLGAEKTGALDALFARAVGAEAATDPRVPALAAAVDANAKETKTIKRLVRWLVNQEIRRQEREGGRVAEPPEDVE
jgi:hypothetical protein